MSLEKSKINFSIVGIMRNEKNTLPRLFNSLTEYLKSGGEVCLLDTGSTDGSAELARSLGAKVWEVGEKHIITIDKDTAKAINDKFVVEEEQDVVKEGSRLFKFCDARNEIASKAENDFVLTVDIDEAYTALNIQELVKLVESGIEQWEYFFCYAHDQIGNCGVSFTQSKAYDRRKLEWRNYVHEVLHPKDGVVDIKRLYVDPSIIKLEHFQEPNKDHRSNYLPGLALDVYMNEKEGGVFADRNFFYFSRECMYHNRPKTAIKSFLVHQGYNGWRAEAGQGLIYIGDCYGMLNDVENQKLYYNKGFDVYPQRREALIKLAHLYKHHNNPHAAAAYANASLVIPKTGFYADNEAEFREIPHEILSWAMNKIGDIGASRWHFHQAYKYKPDFPQYIADSKEILGFQLSSVQGWMTAEEQEALFNEARKANIVVEIGSWKSRSTQALLQGCKGTVYACDTWLGSADVQDLTNTMAKQEDIFEIFKENTKQYNNLKTVRKPSLEACKEFAPKSIDFCFIDAGHSYEECRADALAWWPLVADGGTLAFHDYQQDVWMGVVRCVNDLFGRPDELYGSIAIIRKTIGRAIQR